MTNRSRWMRGAAAGMALLGAIACGGSTEQQAQALNGDLQRDLDLAGAAGVVTSASNGVVSAQEQLPHAQQARPTASRPSTARPRQSPPPAAIAEPVETVAEAPAVAEPAEDVVMPAPAPAPTPAPRPVQQPTQRGGTKTVGQVIRDAPFPIFP